jgi:DNA-binding MarR family transcriptional regulator
VKLADIVGYQLDMTHCAALRCLNRYLAGETLRPADTTALLLAREQPGCDQTLLGRLLAGNRSVGMKVASRLETRGLLTRGAGRDRRSKGLFITAQGEDALTAVLRRHEAAEQLLAKHLDIGEREQLLGLLGKVQRAVDEEEADLRQDTANSEPTGQTSQQTSHTAAA